MLFFVSYSFKPTIQWVFILSACCPISFSALFLSSKAHLIHFSIGLLIFLRIKGFSVTKVSIDSAQSIEDCCIQCKYFTDQTFCDPVTPEGTPEFQGTPLGYSNVHTKVFVMWLLQ